MAHGKKKPIHVGTITSQQLFDMQKPKWDGWAVRGGPHGAVSYDRNRMNREFEDELMEAERERGERYDGR